MLAAARCDSAGSPASLGGVAAVAGAMLASPPSLSRFKPSAEALVLQGRPLDGRVIPRCAVRRRVVIGVFNSQHCCPRAAIRHLARPCAPERSDAGFFETPTSDAVRSDRGAGAFKFNATPASSLRHEVRVGTFTAASLPGLGGLSNFLAVQSGRADTRCARRRQYAADSTTRALRQDSPPVRPQARRHRDTPEPQQVQAESARRCMPTTATLAARSLNVQFASSGPLRRVVRIASRGHRRPRERRDEAPEGPAGRRDRDRERRPPTKGGARSTRRAVPAPEPAQARIDGIGRCPGSSATACNDPSGRRP